jgi:hypothetical protein
MRRRWHKHSFFLWMATFAVLFGALAPAVSVALQGVGTPGWDLICTAQTEQWGAAAPELGTRKSAPSRVHAVEHCPYCSVHAAALGMPPSGSLPSDIPFTHAKHSYYVAAAPTRRLWSYALSRGPPTLPC